MTCLTKIEWEDIYDSLKETLSFIGWDNNMKYLWVKKAWSGIEKIGLTTYSNDIEKHIVYIRLYTILDFYCEFISIAMEREFSIDKDEWVVQFQINPFRMGQLVGQSFEMEEEEEDLLLANALDDLSSQYKSEILDALIKGFGSLSSLFCGLWLTHEILIENNLNADEEPMEESDLNIERYERLIKKSMELILNSDFNTSKIRAYEWLKE
ncbi:hypothetical protein IEO70_15110 [Bacillus sp. AGMB 02131]|uniref:Uncharacterized protein n=1 Tax=Peribacillus faecalis TaxID=2772559 RepID=A0A927CZ43_9BACI|nr:hypothetical protein [Peribacillus faecalis]MBD3109676.1 hypothetical protein [Peribacillus faecalis]